MIHLAHVRDLSAARKWLTRRRLQLESNPVPLLVVTASVDHETVRQTLLELGVDRGCFIVDASGIETGFTVAADTLVIGDPERLHEASDFVERAQRAKQRLDLLYIDEAVRPDLSWCEAHIGQFEALI